jgi:REP element-mobilizing transposase RayT
VNAQHPILVTTRVMPDVARLRTKVMYEAIQAALAGATKWMYEPEPVRFVHASVQGNHLHLLVEAASNEALSRAMKGFLVSCAKRLNKIAGRRGRVFADRFHTRMLATPTAVRNALRYTLCNGRKHGELGARVRLDAYSSAFALPDWHAETSVRFADVTMQVALPQTWVLREGWRRAGTDLAVGHAVGAGVSGQSMRVDTRCRHPGDLRRALEHRGRLPGPRAACRIRRQSWVKPPSATRSMPVL